MLYQAVANQPSIDENENRVAIELLNLRLGNKPVQPDFAKIMWRGRPRPRAVIPDISGFTNGSLFATPPRRRLRQPYALQRLHGR